MRNLFSLLWKMVAGIAAALGFAAMARKYTAPPASAWRDPARARRRGSRCAR
jgi:hypothetical protein